MTSTSNRAPYTGGTPITTTFIPTPNHASIQLQHETEEPIPSNNRCCLSTMKRLYVSAKETASNNTGMLLIAASQAFFSLMNVWVKKLNGLDPPVPAYELILVRMAITWICCVTYMFFVKVPDPFTGPKGVRLLLAFRGFVGFFGLFGVYYSLQYLSLSDATVLTFLAPMCTSITGALILKEDFSVGQGVASLCSLLGVVLIARPAFIFGRASEVASMEVVTEAANVAASVVTPSQRLTAVGVALIGVLGATGAYTTIRAIGERAHPMHNLVSFSSQCVIVSTVLIIVSKTEIVLPMRWDFLAMLLMIGIFGFIAQILLTLGLQRETAGRGTMAVYVQIIFATACEKIFFHSTPTPLSILGTVIIMTAAIYVAVTKENTCAKKRSTTRADGTEDISLREGLLADRVDDDLDHHLPIGKGESEQTKKAVL